MDWEKQLTKYEGSPIRVWIEDRSGEEQTQPKPYTLHKVKQEGQEIIKFYLNPTQFLSIPIFDDGATIMDHTDTESWFVSHDVEAKLLYWVYLA